MMIARLAPQEFSQELKQVVLIATRHAIFQRTGHSSLVGALAAYFRSLPFQDGAGISRPAQLQRGHDVVHVEQQ